MHGHQGHRLGRVDGAAATDGHHRLAAVVTHQGHGAVDGGVARVGHDVVELDRLDVALSEAGEHLGYQGAALQERVDHQQHLVAIGHHFLGYAQHSADFEVQFDGQTCLKILHPTHPLLMADAGRWSPEVTRTDPPFL
ncbi:hypothetical protein D3C76_1522020 [compost metagenome]